MQARRGCGHRPGHCRVDRLIALFVRLVRRSINVGRQRDAAKAGDQRRNRLAEIQPVELALAPENANAVPLQQQMCTRSQRPVDAHLAQCLALALDSLDEDFGTPAGFLSRHQPRLDDTGVVDHQQIAGLQEIGDLDEAPMLGLAIGLQHQQAAGGAFR